MNKKYAIEIGLSVLFVWVSMFGGIVPTSRAQSVQTWSEPVNLSRSGAASNPSLVVDREGVLHVFWVDEFDGHKYVESSDGGLTWTSPINVRFPFSTKSSPVLVSDDSGFIYVFWLSERNELFYARTLAANIDVPSAWQSNTKLDAPVFDFDVAVDAQGNLHLGYVKNPAPAPGIAGAFYRGMLAGTGTWSSATLLYESAYLRSLTTDQARIRVAASDKAGEQHVFVVWDERPQKRIFMAHSADTGSSWGPAREVISPQASLSFKTPYQADVNVLDGKLLMTWQVGDPGVRCAPYSWVSSDQGATWDEPVTILSDSAQCPERSEFISIDPSYAVEFFAIQSDLSLSVWNGTQWSHPEIQSGPSSITNPATFDTVLLGCERAAAFGNRLFVVGCDQNSDGDVWFIARELDPLSNLFPMPSAWRADTTVTDVQQTITSLTSIPDRDNNIHAFWIQAAGSIDDPIEPRIEYARWSSDQWTQPAPITSNLSGFPLDLTVETDSQHRLLIVWVNQSNGDLLFTWANSERANISVEWSQPVTLSVSPLTSSPAILVDALDRIIIAYAVTLNENRGIYIIQSTDLGATWSEPFRVFDAVAANWDMVDNPRLTVTADGRLHVLFTKHKLLGGQEPVGLYYSQSADGGVTWTEPDVVSEQSVQWSAMVSTHEVLYRFWQERERSDLSTYHQSSLDSGATWNTPIKLPVDGTVISEPAVSMDGTGTIHLVHILESDVRNIQEWVWNADRWSLSESRKVAIPEQDAIMPLTSGITSQGHLYALLQFAAPEDAGWRSNLLNLVRSLNAEQAPQPSLASIPTPSGSSIVASMPDVNVAATLVSPLAGLEESRSPVTRNLVGLGLIVIVVLMILIITIPGRSAKIDSSKRTK